MRGRGRRVGDQHDPPRGSRPRGTHHVWGEVVPVDDQLHDHVAPGQRRAGHAGRPMVQPAHGVEQMGDRARPRVEPGMRLLGGRVGVPDRHQHAVGSQRGDHGERTRQLGGERHGDDRATAAPPGHLGGIGVTPVLRGVGAQPVRGQVRPLQVHAERLGAVVVPAAGHGRHHRGQHLQRGRSVGRCAR